MIQFTFDSEDGRRHIGLGITRENLDRLVEGKPIRVDLAMLEDGLDIDGQILIYFGETERELHRALAEFISPETRQFVYKVNPK